MQAPDGLTLYKPRGRTQSEDLDLLAECIANSKADLFNEDGSVIWIDAGKRIGVGTKVLAEIIAKYVVTAWPVNRGDKWTVEFRPVQIDEMALRALFKEEGGLIGRLPKAPQEPVRLTQQQQREVRDRLSIGEPKTRIAAAYKVDVATIELLAR